MMANTPMNRARTPRGQAASLTVFEGSAPASSATPQSLPPTHYERRDQPNLRPTLDLTMMPLTSSTLDGIDVDDEEAFLVAGEIARAFAFAHGGV